MRNCNGSTEQKHCRIKCPSNAASNVHQMPIKCPSNAGFLYFNYKRLQPRNLLGVADTNCSFTLIDVGTQGRENDSSVFSNSSFGKGRLVLVTQMFLQRKTFQVQA
jgi:hypothetical protein